jgi:hypothetical protein
MKPALLVLLLACIWPATAVAQNALLYVDSQLGDDIGAGRELTFASPDSQIVVLRNQDNGVTIQVSTPGTTPPASWTIELAGPNDAALAAGAYQNAVKFGTQGTSQPGLSVSGDGRTCTTVTGSFDVLDVAYDPQAGAVVRFAADVEQHCERVFSALFGSIRYNSAIPAARIVSGFTVVRAGDVAGLRTRIDALRTARGVSPATWTDAALRPAMSVVRAVHLTELRMRVNEEYAAAQRPVPFVPAAVAAGSTIRARDLNDLLDAIGVLERPQTITGLGPSLVTASSRQLLLQRRLPNGYLGSPETFVMRGVTWSPASRTTATTPSDPQNANRRRPEFGIWYRVDIPLMRTMRINTVRLFMDPGFDTTLGPIGLRVLDELYRSGIMVVMTVDDGINDLARVQGAVEYYRHHPAILMWSLGSEWNINRYFRGAAWPPLYAAQRTEIAAQLVKSLDPNHPVVSSYGEIDIATPGLTLADTTHYVQTVVPSVDVWSLNLYRGNTFDDSANRSVFDQWRAISGKPMFIGEYGIDAFHGRCLSNPPSGSVNQAEQVTWNLDLWDDIARNLSAADASKAALGGTVFEWNDEWWKVGSFTGQDTGGWTSDGFPDWHGTEEYFGLVDIDRVPRAAYSALAGAFEPGYVPRPHTITFRAISRGANMCGPQANFRRDGHTFYQRTGGAGGGRGFNVAIVDAGTGEILDTGRNFDTWGGGDPAKQALMNFLNAVPAGRLIMLAVADEAGITLATTNQCTPRTDATTVSLVQLLQSLGSTRIDEYCWRGSWAMVTIKGTGIALAEDYFRTEEARAEPPVFVPE